MIWLLYHLPSVTDDDVVVYFSYRAFDDIYYPSL